MSERDRDRQALEKSHKSNDPSVASFGVTNYAAVYPSASFSGTIPNTHGVWNVQILNLDGTRKSLNSITSSVVITTNTGTTLRSAIASDGTNFLIAIEQDNNFVQTGQSPSIVATRYAADGTIAVQFSNVAPPVGSSSPVLAFDGTNYLLVYSQNNGNGLVQLFGVFISPQTGQTTGAPFPVTPAAGYQLNPALAFDGTNYLAIWDQQTWSTQLPGIFATRITPAGTVLDTQPIQIALQLSCCLASNPAVAFDGTNYLIAYSDYRSPANNVNTTISAARLSKTGVLLDGSATAPGIAVTSAPNSPNYSVAVAYIASDYWLSWLASDGIYGSRISSAGTVLNSGNAGYRMTTGGTHVPVLGGNATGGLMVWTESPVGYANSISAMSIYPVGP
jgi:hypothetical protein